MPDKILLFIPMYNCEKQIVRVAEQLTGEVSSYISEAIFVNNRSTDNGEAVIIKKLKPMQLPFAVKVLRNDENYGLGGSHKVAFNYAMENGFDYVIVLHGDDQGSIENILPYLKNQEYRDYDCFLGARFMHGSKLQGYSKFRTFGNYVYDFLFSVGTGHSVYDLGSGLNMYKTNVLKTRFWEKYKDNLMFNYCMVLGSAFYKHKVHYFPILWREDDQVSNVKMMNQAVVVLKLLGSYIVNKKRFAEGEHRDKIIEKYSAETVFDTKNE
ncbi:MAG: glycosyltransferase family 2 protein [Spirochaetaceae bacterium]|nr:glycosyltransferase family 2 protein [Spirochaetaceae bacterium]